VWWWWCGGGGVVVTWQMISVCSWEFNLPGFIGELSEKLRKCKHFGFVVMASALEEGVGCQDLKVF